MLEQCMLFLEVRETVLVVVSKKYAVLSGDLWHLFG
jgi:hypothetical protein